MSIRIEKCIGIKLYLVQSKEQTALFSMQHRSTANSYSWICSTLLMIVVICLSKRETIFCISWLGLWACNQVRWIGLAFFTAETKKTALLEDTNKNPRCLAFFSESNILLSLLQLLFFTVSPICCLLMFAATITCLKKCIDPPDDLVLEHEDVLTAARPNFSKKCSKEGFKVFNPDCILHSCLNLQWKVSSRQKKLGFKTTLNDVSARKQYLIWFWILFFYCELTIYWRLRQELRIKSGLKTFNHSLHFWEI